MGKMHCDVCGGWFDYEQMEIQYVEEFDEVYAYCPACVDWDEDTNEYEEYEDEE